MGYKTVIFTNLKNSNDWYDLTYNIKAIDGVEEVLSIAKIYYLHKNTETKKFDLKLVSSEKTNHSKSNLTVLKKKTHSLKFFERSSI